MATLTHKQLAPDLSQWVVQALTRLLATYCLVQGFIITTSPADPWRHSPALKSALAVPGAPATWGVVLLILGVLVLWGTFLPRPGLVSVGLWLASSWSGFFAIAQLNAIAHNSQGTVRTGLSIYVFVGIVGMVLAIAYRRSA